MVIIDFFPHNVIGIFIVALGLIKALHPHPFFQHITNIKIFSERLSVFLAFLFIELEVAFGVLLLLNIFLKEVIPIIIGLLFLFSGLTLWGVKYGRTQDCGCYGGLLKIKPFWSYVINGVAILLLLITYFYWKLEETTANWKIFFALFSMFFTGFLCKRSIKKPIVDFSRVKKGKSWKTNWLLGQVTLPETGDCFLALLQDHCPKCRKWIPMLNILDKKENAPKVLGVMIRNDIKGTTHKWEEQPEFDLYYFKSGSLNLLVNHYPTGILIRDGTVDELWSQEFPFEYS